MSRLFFFFCFNFISTFCGDIPLPGELCRKTQDLITKISGGLNRFASGDLSDLEAIISDFNDLYARDILEFYKVIWSSPHRFTLPVAFFVIQPENGLLLGQLKLLISGFSVCSDHFEFYLLLLEVVTEGRNLLSEIVFSSDNGFDIDTRKKVIEYFSACFYKLFKIYKSEASLLKICSGNTKTFYESHDLDEETIITTINWWKKLLLMPSNENSLLFHIDPQISLPIFMNDLIEKAHADPGYQMEPRENFILSNLIAKVIESESCLEFLASQSPEFNCYFWYIIAVFPKFTFTKANPLPSFWNQSVISLDQMAYASFYFPLFKKRCRFKYGKFVGVSFEANPDVQGFAVKIVKQMYDTAYSKSKPSFQM
jgi:hypothetical protein